MAPTKTVMTSATSTKLPIDSLVLMLALRMPERGKVMVVGLALKILL
jgi:hypothetical protein